MNGSHSERQRVLLALLARIRREPSYKRRLALREELAALVASYGGQLDGKAADFRAKSAAKPKRKHDP